MWSILLFFSSMQVFGNVDVADVAQCDADVCVVNTENYSLSAIKNTIVDYADKAVQCFKDSKACQIGTAVLSAGAFFYGIRYYWLNRICSIQDQKVDSTMTDDTSKTDDASKQNNQEKNELVSEKSNIEKVLEGNAAQSDSPKSQEPKNNNEGRRSNNRQEALRRKQEARRRKQASLQGESYAQKLKNNFPSGDQIRDFVNNNLKSAEHYLEEADAHHDYLAI